MEINNEVITNAAGILGTIGAVVFGLQKTIKIWTADRGDIQKIGIDSDLFKRLNEELKRLSETNQHQEKELEDMRQKYLKLIEDFTMIKIDAATKDSVIAGMIHRLNACNDRLTELQTVQSAINIANGGK